MLVRNHPHCHCHQPLPRPKHHREIRTGELPQDPFQGRYRQIDRVRQYAALWAGVVLGTGLTAPLEMTPGSQLQLGIHHLQVEPNGNMTVQEARLGEPVHGCSGQARLSGRSPSGLEPSRLEPGVVHLPNGQSLSLSTPGVVLVYPSGDQFGMGRESAQATISNRQVAAGPGQAIPSSPPGQTTYVFLSLEGGAERVEVR